MKIIKYATQEKTVKSNGAGTSCPTQNAPIAKRDVLGLYQQNASPSTPPNSQEEYPNELETYQQDTIVYGFDARGHYRFIALAGSLISDNDRPPGTPNFRLPTIQELAKINSRVML